MDGNEFRRRVQAVSDPNARHLMMQNFEMTMEMARQLDACIKMVTELTGTVAQFVSLNEAMNGKLMMLQRTVTGNRDGVALNSVPITDHDDG